MKNLQSISGPGKVSGGGSPEFIDPNNRPKQDSMEATISKVEECANQVCSPLFGPNSNDIQNKLEKEFPKKNITIGPVD